MINCKKCGTQIKEVSKNKECSKCSNSKKYFDVKVECTIPATLVYRIKAHSAQEASEMINYIQPNEIKYKLQKKKMLKILVFESGSVILKFIKNILL